MLRCFSCGAVQRKLNVAAFLRVEDRKNQEFRAVTLCSERSTRMARCSGYLLTCYIIIFENFGSYKLTLLLGSAPTLIPAASTAAGANTELRRIASATKFFYIFDFEFGI
jgi:hypothetical protein